MSSQAGRCVQLITGTYLLVTAPLVLMARHDFPHWQTAFGFHLAGAALALGILSRTGGFRVGWLRFLADWYPVFLFLPLYKEVEVLAAALGDWSLTGTVQSIELGMFREYPAQWLSRKWNYLWLSEVLHFCYLSYGALIPAVGGYWYFTGRREAFRRMLSLVAAGYFVSYLIYIFYPVDSPYYLFDSLAHPLDQGWIYRIVHFASDRGGARGGAFPSTHVAVSSLILLAAWKQERRIGYLLVPLVAGIYLATIYGRFHYALDVVAGSLLAATIYGVFRRSGMFADVEMLYRRLNGCGFN